MIRKRNPAFCGIRTALLRSYSTIGAIGVVFLLLGIVANIHLGRRVEQVTEVRMPITESASRVRDAYKHRTLIYSRGLLWGSQRAKPPEEMPGKTRSFPHSRPFRNFVLQTDVLKTLNDCRC